MLAYHFDESGYFDGVIECQKDDLESIRKVTAVFLQPANSTKIKPPEPKEGFRIRWSGEGWEYEEIQIKDNSTYTISREEKENQVRGFRNFLLLQTDPVMLSDYPISDRLREDYKAYRQYLRDYTKKESWFEANPLTYEAWSS